MSLPKIRIEIVCNSHHGSLSTNLTPSITISSIQELDESTIKREEIVNEITDTLFKLVISDLKKVGRSKSYKSFFNNGKKINIQVIIYSDGRECFNSDDFGNVSSLFKLKFSEKSLDRIKSLLIYLLSVNSMREFYKGEELLSHFEKAKILEGMFSSKARGLAKVYLINKSWGSKELESVNQIIEKLRLKYGMDFLRAILTIDKGEKETFFAPNKLVLLRPDSSTRANFSIIHEGVEYSFMERNKSFRLTKKKSEFKRRNSNSNNEERDWMDLSLVLYAKVSQDPLDYIIQYGIETENCSFCGLKLEDPTSLLVGYGKTCAEKNNLLWG